ncbi:12128_t:CDS:2, partial [Ambispora leptoticha]
MPEQQKPKLLSPEPKKPITSLTTNTDDDDSEEARIKAMFKQTTEQWEQQQEKLAEATPIYNNKRRQPHNTPQNTPQKIPPPNYVCFRCGTKGHYINNCPTNGDKEYDKNKIKRTTGIPRSFLKQVDEPKKNGTGGLMVTPQGGLVIAVADNASWERHKAITRAPLGNNGDIYEQAPVKPEMECTLCHHLLREAVTIPCCNKNFCDDCVRNYLLEHNFVCPSCGTTDQIPDSLVRNRTLREEIEKYLKEYAIKLKNAYLLSTGSTPKTPPKDIDDSGSNITSTTTNK